MNDILAWSQSPVSCGRVLWPHDAKTCYRSQCEVLCTCYLWVPIFIQTEFEDWLEHTLEPK